MNKKAIQLSVNFIVILIISIVVFGFGITLAYNLVNKGVETKESLDAQTDLELEKLLDTGEKVVIPFNRKEIYPGNKAVVWIGIRNVLDTPGESDVFNIQVNLRGAFEPDGREPINSAVSFSKSFPDSLEIKKNEKAKVPVAFSLPDRVRKGIYRYDVIVLDPNNEQYGFTKHIDIIVP